MKAWLQLISIGMVGAMVATSCVIVDDDDDDDNGGEAGDSSTGGRATGGRSGGTGGTTGGRATGGTNTGGTSTGGTGTGGITGEGGEGGTTVDACKVESTPFGNCGFLDEAVPCEACLADNCCDEVSACFGTDPEDVCGYPLLMGEFECTRDCLIEFSASGDIPAADDVDQCMAECMKCGEPSPNTHVLVGCMDTSCSEECY